LTEVSEPETDSYPSVTICPGISEKPDRKLILEMLDAEDEKGKSEINEMIMKDILDKYSYNYQIKEIIGGVYQEYLEGWPHCDRTGDPGRNLVDDEKLWNYSIPHTQDSGRCFTYKY